MLRSDFSHKAHVNFHNYFLYAMCMFQRIDVKLTSIYVKLKSILNKIFILVFL